MHHVWRCLDQFRPARCSSFGAGVILPNHPRRPEVHGNFLEGRRLVIPAGEVDQAGTAREAACGEVTWNICGVNWQFIASCKFSL